MRNLTKEYRDYQNLVMERQEIISINRSNFMRGFPALPVPIKPVCPKVPIAYERDGTYAGRLASAEDCPNGCVVRFEDANW